MQSMYNPGKTSETSNSVSVLTIFFVDCINLPETLNNLNKLYL